MGPTVEGAVIAFLQSRRTRRHKTYVRYHDYLTNFVDWCLAHNPEVKYLEHVTAATVRGFVTFLQRKGQAETTIQNKTKYVKTFLKWCSLEDEFEYFVSEREVRKIEIPKVHDKEISIFSDEEIAALLRSAGANQDVPRARRNVAIILTLLDTGCRASEIAVDSERPEEKTGMYLSDLVLNDPRDPRIKVHGKGGKPREVPVGEKTSKALRLYINRYREETLPGKGHLFFSRGTTPLTRRPVLVAFMTI
jgi:site-specific recombinase XerD